MAPQTLLHGGGRGRGGPRLICICLVLASTLTLTLSQSHQFQPAGGFQRRPVQLPSPLRPAYRATRLSNPLRLTSSQGLQRPRSPYLTRVGSGGSRFRPAGGLSSSPILSRLSPRTQQLTSQGGRIVVANGRRYLVRDRNPSLLRRPTSNSLTSGLRRSPLVNNAQTGTPRVRVVPGTTSSSGLSRVAMVPRTAANTRTLSTRHFNTNPTLMRAAPVAVAPLKSPRTVRVLTQSEYEQYVRQRHAHQAQAAATGTPTTNTNTNFNLQVQPASPQTVSNPQPQPADNQPQPQPQPNPPPQATTPQPEPQPQPQPASVESPSIQPSQQQPPSSAAQEAPADTHTSLMLQRHQDVIAKQQKELMQLQALFNQLKQLHDHQHQQQQQQQQQQPISSTNIDPTPAPSSFAPSQQEVAPLGGNPNSLILRENSINAVTKDGGLSPVVVVDAASASSGLQGQDVGVLENLIGIAKDVAAVAGVSKGSEVKVGQPSAVLDNTFMDGSNQGQIGEATTVPPPVQAFPQNVASVNAEPTVPPPPTQAPPAFVVFDPAQDGAGAESSSSSGGPSAHQQSPPPEEVLPVILPALNSLVVEPPSLFNPPPPPPQVMPGPSTVVVAVEPAAWPVVEDMAPTATTTTTPPAAGNAFPAGASAASAASASEATQTLPADAMMMTNNSGSQQAASSSGGMMTSETPMPVNDVMAPAGNFMAGPVMDAPVAAAADNGSAPTAQVAGTITPRMVPPSQTAPQVAGAKSPPSVPPSQSAGTNSPSPPPPPPPPAPTSQPASQAAPGVEPSEQAAELSEVLADHQAEGPLPVGI